MIVDRRTVLKGVFSLPAFAILSRAVGPRIAGMMPGSARALVVLHLVGGNDGLNTVVPINDPRYSRLRPGLALGRNEVLPIERGLALHPALEGFKKLYEKGQLAIVLGAGYPNPDFSHFRATEIWQAANPSGGASGWIGRYLDETREHRGTRAIALGDEPGLALASSSSLAVSVSDLGRFAPPADAERIRTMYAAYARDTASRRLVGEAGLESFDAAEKIRNLRDTSTVNYPQGPLAADLRRAAALIGSGLGVEVVYLTFGGFDTHVAQAGKHRQLLRQVGDAFAAFQQDLEHRGVARSTATVIFSEFGRRPTENQGGGTDHGSAGPMFVIGEGVRAGLHGEQPSLADLDNGNLVFTTDFRAVYAGLLRDALRTDPVPVVGSTPPVQLF